MSTFADTSFWYALSYANDRHNARAKLIAHAGHEFVTTDHILVETWLLLQRRRNQQAANTFWRNIRDGAAKVEEVIAADLDAAWAIGQAFPDQAFSIVDRTSFVVMERRGLRRAASFDDDFAIYRYGPRRSLAFEVVR